MSSQLEEEIRRVLANRANAVTADHLQPAIPPTASAAPSRPRRMLMLTATATAATAVIATVVLLVRPLADSGNRPADSPASATTVTPAPSSTAVPSSCSSTPALGPTASVPMRSYPVKPGDNPLGNVVTGSPVRTPSPGETDAVPARSHPVTPESESPDCR